MRDLQSAQTISSEINQLFHFHSSADEVILLQVLVLVLVAVVVVVAVVGVVVVVVALLSKPLSIMLQRSVQQTVDTQSKPVIDTF